MVRFAILTLAALVAFGLATWPVLAEVPEDYDSSDAEIDVRFSPYQSGQALVLEELEKAESEIRIAHYNIRNNTILKTLARLKTEKDIDIKVVIDEGKAAESEERLNILREAGIDVLTYKNPMQDDAIMHTKLCVIDQKTVLTGSYNWNYTAEHANNEACMAIRSPSVAKLYLEEWREVAGDLEEESKNLEFFPKGKFKDERIRVYFSPEDYVQYRIIDELTKSGVKRIRIAMYTFFNPGIAKALIAQAQKGVQVELVLHESMADMIEYDEQIEAAGGLVIRGKPRSSAMSDIHHKFCVINDQTVITGACNWSVKGMWANNEDTLVINDPDLAESFNNEWEGLAFRYSIYDDEEDKIPDYPLPEEVPGIEDVPVYLLADIPLNLLDGFTTQVSMTIKKVVPDQDKLEWPGFRYGKLKLVQTDPTAPFGGRTELPGGITLTYTYSIYNKATKEKILDPAGPRTVYIPSQPFPFFFRDFWIPELDENAMEKTDSPLDEFKPKIDPKLHTPGFTAEVVKALEGLPPDLSSAELPVPENEPEIEVGD